MQKQIVFICILITKLINAMEYENIPPRQLIIGYININQQSELDALAMELSKTHPHVSYIQLSQEDKLSHQSPLIKAIHSKSYLDNIEKHPSVMLSAITNTWLPAIYPHRYSRTYFDEMLNHCATTTLATKMLINLIEKKYFPPHYTISLAEGYSFAGHAEGNNGHAYAAIPLAAMYALNTKIIKHILIFDENVTLQTGNEYCDHGNGSFFYQQNNPELFTLFSGKIITYPASCKDNTLSYKTNFLNSSDDPIDLAFYNINIKNSNETITERAFNIATLLNKLIPTVFILSGDKNKYKKTACRIINHIINVAKLCTQFARYNSPRLLPKTSKSHASSPSSQNSDKSDDADETPSSDTEDYNERFVFKVTINPEETQKYDGANFIYLAKNITIDNGIMEIECDDNYMIGYYHSPTSSDDSDDKEFNENSEHYEEQNYSEETI